VLSHISDNHKPQINNVQISVTPELFRIPVRSS